MWGMWGQEEDTRGIKNLSSCEWNPQIHDYILYLNSYILSIARFETTAIHQSTTMDILEPGIASRPLRIQDQDLKGKVALITYV